MLSMQLALNIDAQRLIQNIQINNLELEKQVEKGINKAIEELSKDGVIEEMIVAAAKKQIMDTFSRWVFQSDIRRNIEKQLTEKMSDKVEAYTTALVNEIADKMNLPK